MPSNREVMSNDALLDEFENDQTPLPADYDADADAYAPPPPLPDGKYLAVLGLAGVKDPQTGNVVDMIEVQWGNDQQPYPWIPLEAKVYDPNGREDGKYATDGLFRCRPDKNGRNPVETVYRAATGEPCPGVSLRAKAAAFVKMLRTNPMVTIETQLQASAKDASGKRVNWKGEDKFKDSNGKMIGYVEYNGERLVGRPAIIGISAKS